MKRTFLIFSVALFLTSLVSVAFYSGKVNARIADIRFTATPSPTPLPLGTPTPKPTPDDEIIKIDTELVNLTVRVVDRNNRSINNIPENEFKIYEDGSIQKIDFFSTSEVPTNYAIVVDNSGSMRQQLDKVIEAGKIMINTNRQPDESEIIRFVGRDKISVEQTFTSSKTDLIDSLDNLFIEGGQTAIIDAVYLAVQSVDAYEKTQKVDDHKRRALILVSDGEDRDSFYNEKQLFDLLKESEVQIYVIGLIDDLSKEGGFIGKSPQGKAKAFLERMANETGGKAYFPANANALPQLAREISSELRTQYSIGYIPSNERRDGTYRAIKVSVSDGPNNQKRIAVTRSGRTADGGVSTKETPKPTPVTKNP